MAINFAKLLKEMGNNTSDLHLKTGQPPVYRINGELVKVNDEAVTKLSEGETPWRKAMSPHQAARAIVLAVSGEPGFEPVLEKLGLRKVNEQ